MPSIHTLGSLDLVNQVLGNFLFSRQLSGQICFPNLTFFLLKWSRADHLDAINRHQKQRAHAASLGSGGSFYPSYAKWPNPPGTVVFFAKSPIESELIVPSAGLRGVG